MHNNIFHFLFFVFRKKKKKFLRTGSFFKGLKEEEEEEEEEKKKEKIIRHSPDVKGDDADEGKKMMIHSGRAWVMYLRV
jgi:hypothetical protein